MFIDVGMGCLLPTSSISTAAYVYIKAKSVGTAVFLDIEGAFDNVALKAIRGSLS